MCDGAKLGESTSLSSAGHESSVHGLHSAVLGDCGYQHTVTNSLGCPTLQRKRAGAQPHGLADTRGILVSIADAVNGGHFALGKIII